MSNNGAIITDHAPKPVGLYPHAKWVGDLLFLSGVGPRSANSNDIPGVILDNEGHILSYDIKAQCHSVFTNVKHILKAAGTTFDNLIDVTVFLTNMKADFEQYNKIYAEYFKVVQPTRTTLGISALPTPIAIELKCIASR